MRLAPHQIVRSAEALECPSCGAQATKPCSCKVDSFAVTALRAAVKQYEDKKERERQRSQTRRDRAATAVADVENIEENEPETEGDDDQTVWRRGLMFRAKTARTAAEFENWKRFKVDRQLVEEANAAAAAWEKLAEYLEGLYHGKH